MANKIDAKPGDLITVEDFMKAVVTFMTPSEPNYKNKITIVFDDGSRMIVLKNQRMWYAHNYQHASYYDGWETNSSSLKVGDTIPMAGLRMGKGWNGNCQNMPRGKQNIKVQKIIDPADNSLYEGVGNHKFEAKMPVPGEIISVADIKNFLVSTGTKMFEYTTVNVFEWFNHAWQNNKNNWPYWVDPGGDISKSAGDGFKVEYVWQHKRLTAPITTSEGLYKNVDSESKLHEDQLISIYHLQRLISKMYVTNNNRGIDYIHHVTCHNNCHRSCHCARW